MVVDFGELGVHLLEHGQSRHDIQEHGLADPRRVVDTEGMCNSCAAVMAADVKAIVETKFIHDADTVLCHGALAVWFMLHLWR